MHLGLVLDEEVESSKLADIEWSWTAVRTWSEILSRLPSSLQTGGPAR